MAAIFPRNPSPTADRRDEPARAGKALLAHLARHGAADVDGKLAGELSVSRKALWRAAAGLAMREELHLTSSRAGGLVAMTNERFAAVTAGRARRSLRADAAAAAPAAGAAGRKHNPGQHDWFSLDVARPKAAKNAGGVTKRERKILPGRDGWRGVRIAGLD